MHKIYKPNNFKEWSETACNKIIRTISSCITLEQLDNSKRMIDNFVVISAIEDDIETDELESIVSLIWLRHKLQFHIIDMKI